MQSYDEMQFAVLISIFLCTGESSIAACSFPSTGSGTSSVKALKLIYADLTGSYSSRDGSRTSSSILAGQRVDNDFCCRLKLVRTVISVYRRSMFLPLMLPSLVRLITALTTQPTSTVTTLLYCGNLLPRSIVGNLQRLVRHELLDRENYLFHVVVNVMRCFW